MEPKRPLTPLERFAVDAAGYGGGRGRMYVYGKLEQCRRVREIQQRHRDDGERRIVLCR